MKNTIKTIPSLIRCTDCKALVPTDSLFRFYDLSGSVCRSCAEKFPALVHPDDAHRFFPALRVWPIHTWN